MANIAELLLRPENEKLLRAHIRSIVRMSYESPFDDIMDGCRNILVRVSRVRSRCLVCFLADAAVGI